MKKLFLVKISVDYCNYLRKYDEKVPYNDKYKGLRPFIGVLFEINGCEYFAPLSSPKNKHLKMHDLVDFVRIDEGRLGAINFNNMIPVKSANYIILNLNDTAEENGIDNRYYILLKKQVKWLNQNKIKILDYSKKLYDDYKRKKLNINIMKRCCNFTLLEEKCNEYNQVKITN